MKVLALSAPTLERHLAWTIDKRSLTDARLSPESRQLWYDGWNYQDALMRPVPTNEEIEDTASFLQSLKQGVKEGSL
jgi:hypothetical protein